MRIGFLTHEPFFPPSGGGSAAAVYLVQELARRGHKVDVFGPKLEDHAAVEARFAVRLRPFTAWKMGRTTPLRTPKYLAYPSALARLVRCTVASEGRYDVLVSQHSISAVAAGRLKQRLGIPAVFNLLDCLTGFMETWPPWLMPRPVARALVRYELSLPRRYSADGVLTVSDPLLERVIANGYPAERGRAIYYGYDAELFQPAPTAHSESSAAAAPLIVMHGSFDHHHLGEIARTAVLTLHRQKPSVRFRFVGPRTPALRKFLRDLRAEAPAIAAEDTGFIPYDRVPSLLAEATVGITPYEPSTGTHCAFVAKTVEYLALGLPVVCTPLESALRYYRGLEGVKFSDTDGVSFAGRIQEWLSLSDAERRAAVEPARRKVQTELTWSAICRRAAEFIEERIGRSRG